MPTLPSTVRLSLLAAVLLGANTALAADPWVVMQGKEGPGKGKHIVFVTGDEEYRSEESMPQLAKILAQRHGFKCTVLFAIDPKTGEINPNVNNNIPGLEALKTADLMVLFVRFRQLPDEQMKHIMDYTNSGKPIIALRTATHPFAYGKDSKSAYAKWTWNNGDPAFRGGYGRQVLGETWVNHYGHHQHESTRGLVAEGMKDHPLVRGCEVYEITKLHGDAQPVIMGAVLKGMDPKDEPNPDKKLMPIAWIKTYKGDEGKTSKVFTTTMGHAGDLESEGFRRLLVNAAYWLLDMEVPARADAATVGEYKPTPIGGGKFKKGVKPSDHSL